MTFEIIFGEVEARRPNDEQRTEQAEKPEIGEGCFMQVLKTTAIMVAHNYPTEYVNAATTLLIVG